MRRRRHKVKSKSFRGLGRLSAAPEQHGEQESRFAKQAKDKLAAMSEAIRDKKCSVAFARLIDGVSYSGMAEAEAANANRSTSRYALDATEAMKLFKTACKVGEGE